MISIPYMLFLLSCWFVLLWAIIRSYINETEELAREFDNPGLRVSKFWYKVLAILPVGVVVALLGSVSWYLFGGV